MSIRKRLTQEESRSVALEAARALLLESGPQAVTLKAVAARMGRTHANLLHHFGSAAGLQKALAGQLATGICATIEQAVFDFRAGTATPRKVVDLAFDAFGREGAGALASWMLLTGNEDALDPIVGAIHDLVDHLHDGEDDSVSRTVLKLCLLALGDAQLGRPLAAALDLPPCTARDMAEKMLVESTAGRLQEPAEIVA
ncbi:MAG: TetR family transcriptional regulator [Sphingomonadales bacterium]|nr:TetR family transcriptional regulator [Sphingomonadales bacterium]